MPPKPGSLAARLDTTTDVMVVEDEPDIANFLAAFFRASGMGMVHVNPRSVDEVVDAAIEHGVSCLLLDIGLNGLSGLEVLAAIRRHDRLARLPVIVVSAYNDAATIGRARELGVTGYFPKPFAVAELFDQVVAVMSGNGALPDAGVLGRADLEEELAVALSGREPAVGFALVRVRGAVEPVAEALTSRLPRGSVVGRSAEDELAVVLPDTDAPSAVGLLTEVLDGYRAVAGVAAVPDHATTGDELYMAADAALAEAAEYGPTVAVAR
jgi:CheY-like chemotaxis protein